MEAKDPTNVIVQAKVASVNGPQGAAHALMIAVNIDNPETADEFVTEVTERFKVERMLSLPDTKMLLITLMGELTAPRFAERWAEIRRQDPIVQHFMSLMVAADVIQATPSGQPLSRASLL